MPRNKRAAAPRSSSEASFFVHPKVAELYQVRDRQPDTLLRIPALQWRGLLSRITPQVAAHLVASGSNLLTRTAHTPL